jgi:uncharacterized protein YyaL (SSP411 family)
LPAGNAVAAGNLLALAALQNEPQFRALAERTLAAGLAATAEQPGRAAQLALVLWQWSSSAAQRPAAP